MDVLQAIGNTTAVQLRNVVPSDCARIFAKVEWENPTGSMKDRMAQAVIERAEEDGRLRPGDTVVEYTGGSTGASLALVCSAKGYRLRVGEESPGPLGLGVRDTQWMAASAPPSRGSPPTCAAGRIYRRLTYDGAA